MSTQRKNFKCVVVGDGAVGKSSLIYMFTYNSFPQDYIPTVFDNCNASIEIDNVTYDLGIWDTAGQEEFDNIRPVSYHNTDVAILCYDICHPDSLKNIKTKWIKEIHKYMGANPNLILVGTKEDLRDDQDKLRMLAQENQRPVSKQEGDQVAAELKAKKHITCSAKLNYEVNTVFETVVKIAKQPGKKKLCG